MRHNCQPQMVFRKNNKESNFSFNMNRLVFKQILEGDLLNEAEVGAYILERTSLEYLRFLLTHSAFVRLMVLRRK